MTVWSVHLRRYRTRSGSEFCDQAAAPAFLTPDCPSCALFLTSVRRSFYAFRPNGLCLQLISVDIILRVIVAYPREMRCAKLPVV